ncbi:hypothetical protein CK203_052955 [Vitis vinifera]|uniref:Uncharacterized protein n=1 Tax=Vitis vinifera TaxID=29760 RepID=A0A438GSY8_VITVI|nr:hypothetical protein CK203_052955 [Vitis vinifera]
MGNPLGCQGGACVEVMTTLHGSAPSFQRRAEGWLHTIKGSIDTFGLGSTSWIQVEGRLIRVQEVPPQDGAQYDSTMPLSPPPSQSTLQAIPFTLHSQTKVAPPPVTVPIPTSEDPHAHMDRLEQRLRQLRTSDRDITWEDFDGAPVANLPPSSRC